MHSNKGTRTRDVAIIFIAIFFVGNFAWAKKPQEIPETDPVKRAWQIIDEGIENKDPDKRFEIVLAAGLGGPNEKVFTFLTKALDDKKVSVRTAACASLASLKNKGAIEPLKKALKDPVPEVFFCAAQGLWAMGDPAGEKVLLEVLAGEKGTASGYLTTHQRQAMAAFNSKKRFFTTLFHLGIRFAPVPGLAMGYSTMQELASDHKAGGQVHAALDLAHGTDPESLQALRNALKDKSPLVRAAAVHSLALRNDPSVKDDLIPLMGDKTLRVQDFAAVAYLRLNYIEQEAKTAATQMTDAEEAKKPGARGRPSPR
jgi:HEAT repeat protein